MLTRVVAFLAFFVLLFAVGYALAQQVQQAPSSPREQALTQRLINEIDTNLACNTNVITLQAEINKLKTEPAAKTETGTDPAKKQDQLPKKQ